MTSSKPFQLIDLLLPYQRRFFEAKQRKKIFLSSRQIGKSFVLAFTAAYEALIKQNNLVLCISTGSRAANELLKKCAMMAEAVKKLSGGTIAYSSSADCVKFSNGGRILSLPSGNPNALRGFTAAATIVDECAFIENPEDVFEAITPTLTRDKNSKLLVASTPAGCQGKFWDIWANGDDSWYRQETTIHDAIADGLKVDLDELRKLTPDEDVFACEFECKFSKEFGSFIDPDLLDFYDVNNEKGAYYLGVDYGRKNDATSLTIVKAVKDHYYLENIVNLRNTSYQEQFDVIKELHEKYKFTAGYQDSNGIGSAIAEQVQKQICSKIKPFTMTAASKTPAYEFVRNKIFDHKLAIASAWKDYMIKDFRGVNKLISDTGKVSYVAGRSDQGHSDTTSSLVLALQAIHDNPVNATAPATY